jgi:hypothetical protein
MRDEGRMPFGSASMIQAARECESVGRFLVSGTTPSTGCALRRLRLVFKFIESALERKTRRLK